jgi:hypothetical protein
MTLTLMINTVLSGLVLATTLSYLFVRTPVLKLVEALAAEPKGIEKHSLADPRRAKSALAIQLLDNG